MILLDFGFPPQSPTTPSVPRREREQNHKKGILILKSLPFGEGFRVGFSSNKIT